MIKLDPTRIPKLIPLFLITFLGVITLLPILAPILSHYNLNFPANIIYKVYSYTCHQKASRSFFVFDKQMAWCARDTFIWFSLFLASLLTFIMSAKKSLSLRIALLFMLPMVLDGSIQLISTVLSLYNAATPFYESTNLFRALTGTLFGIGLGMYLFPNLQKGLNPEQNAQNDDHVVSISN